ncbi:MAG: 2-hydroxyacyl-CoA dehydratase family protein [Euryarchaeota archaeon]|nr:2-hydroxyacyl-CoA dehydratase family protein [Euryarchaeota archaeon]MCG2736229.1 2-hydroxyacyl-CoA dehydratase family protein [Candidatus Methanoperedenaceae archaeon]
MSRQFSYPEELKSEFIETDSINFKDGTSVSTSEIWKFMTDEGPRRFPFAFDSSANHIGRLSEDVEFFSGIKRGYLTLSLRDRLLKAHEKGVPIILIQGGQSMDPYYAAGGIPLRPGFVSMWARDMKEGLNLREADRRGVEILESGRKTISIEACNQVAAHAAIDDGIVPVDLIAPYLCLRCSDMAYLVESHRNKKGNVPRYLVDYPIDQKNKEWAVDYMATMLRTLTKKISDISGKETTDKDIREEIKVENKGRQLARELTEIWWSAKLPPTNSTDFYGVPFLANDFVGDPVATVGVLEGTKKEVKERVKHSVKGTGVAEDPKRLYVCGSCVGPNPNHVEKAGAVLVGRDDNWSTVSTDVKVSGDPYENLAKAILSFPYEQPTEKRAEWTAEQVKKSRADGLIFMYQWGCNYQTSVARMMADIIKEQTGVPTTFIEVGELGRMEALEQSENRVEAFIEMLR